MFFFDESGVNLSMARLYGRSTRGERVVGHVPKNWGDNVTLAAAIGLGGLIAPLLLPGSMNAEVLEAYVEQFLLPELRPGDIVLWDNLGAHKHRDVVRVLEDANVRVVFLPPYSPDMNPIELAWSKVKQVMRSCAPRNLEALEEAAVTALRAVTPHDIAGWFRHAGYLG
jgi:transposase